MRKTPPKQRRALSTVRSGEIALGGDEAAAAALSAAIAAPAEGDEIAASYTHPFHSYPARMHPATARHAVALVAEPGDLLLDPFCGAGTVLVEARAAGVRAIGVDVNPLAVRIAFAKTWAPRAGRGLRALKRAGLELVDRALAEVRAARRSGHRAPLRAPKGVDARARNRALSEWFAPHIRRELEFLAGGIEQIERRDRDVAVILTTVLSAILYKVSRRASDTDSRRVDRNVARGAPSRLFRERLTQLCDGIAALRSATAVPGPVELKLGDARRLVEVGVSRRSIDAIVTSPPYAGTYDYADQHQLRLDFLGLSPRAFPGSEIGARRGFRGDASAVRRGLRRWHKDLGDSLGDMARALRPGGRAVVVLGDSVAGSRAVYADETLTECIDERLQIVAWASQTRPKLGGREKRAFGDRPKREHLFLLER